MPMRIKPAEFLDRCAWIPVRQLSGPEIQLRAVVVGVEQLTGGAWWLRFKLVDEHTRQELRLPVSGLKDVCWCPDAKWNDLIAGCAIG